MNDRSAIPFYLADKLRLMIIDYISAIGLKVTPPNVQTPQQANHSSPLSETVIWIT
jgi:hypothetical protein